MFKNVIMICFTAVSISFSAPAACAEPKLNPENNRWYDIITADPAAADYWQDIEQKAVSSGSHLAAINDASEQAWVFANIVSGTYRNYWIGLNDALVEDTLTWVNGEDYTYANWYSAWDNTPSRDYVYIRQSDGRWDFGARDEYKLGIAEWPASTAPEPVSSSLLLSGGILILLRRMIR